MAKSEKVTPDNFEAGITAIMERYMVELRNASEKDLNAAARTTLKDLKTTTPAGAGKYRDWGAYQAGWGKETKKDGYGNVTVLVKNKTSPGLTHLLEKGHVMANGKSSGSYPHIKPAGEHGVEELRRKLK